MPFPRDRKYTSEEFFALFPEDDGQMYELYNGEIVALASPSILHQRISMKISTSINNYISKQHGKCEVFAATFDVKLDDYTVVIPDISVICDPSKLSDGKRCNGAPDFVIEIASGNWKDDFVRKLGLYLEHGVREYWIVDPVNEKVVVYLFKENNIINMYTFDQNIPVGIYQKNEIGLKINIAELLA